MIEIVDDLLEPHVAEYIDMQMRDVSWKYDYKSNQKKVNKHWHVLCGHAPKKDLSGFNLFGMLQSIN